MTSFIPDMVVIVFHPVVGSLASQSKTLVNTPKRQGRSGIWALERLTTPEKRYFSQLDNFPEGVGSFLPPPPVCVYLFCVSEHM